MREKLVKQALEKLFEIDPWLEDYQEDLTLRMNNYFDKKEELLEDNDSLVEFANAHHFFGFHRTDNGWVYREWAPAAYQLYLTGDFNNWDPHSHPLQRIDNGAWEIHLDGQDSLQHGQRVKVVVHYDGMDHYKIPLYIKRVVQEHDPHGNVDWMGIIWDPEEDFTWSDKGYENKKPKAPLIYEAHVGLSSEEGKVNSYREFADNVLPRIKENGYNTVQLMAIMQHPYYGSFGYHVANFFAVSSWFGTPDDLKYLINKAHSMGMSVLMDLVHSHAVKNTVEGINRFDGTQTQFFYEGHRGLHDHWDSMCFDYDKNEVLHFLLSNLKYWQEEYHFDGFRFDGITSMLYWDHGMGESFDNYGKYFTMNTNTDAVTYLMLASEIIHDKNPNALLIAEDMSGMPGLCLPISHGGIGFDYRLAMGVPDMWIKNMKKNDYDWNMFDLYYELTTKRPQEKRINYAESHDQSLVGDKTLFFWLTDAEAYWHMRKDDENYIIDRAIALHKMIRLITIATGADGYLNFIGNEFGHPEWVDFPRAENGWSFHYCRRQWSLVDNPDLRYEQLNNFDKDMLSLMKEDHLLGSHGLQYLTIDQDRKYIAFRNNNYIFIFNFHPSDSYEQLQIPVHDEGIYNVIFSTDRDIYGGFSRIDEMYGHVTRPIENADFESGISVYLPSRTAIVLKKKHGSSEAAYEEEREALENMFEAEQKAQEALKEKNIDL